MNLSIIAPAVFGNDRITEPHIVQQLWRDVLGELIVPRSQEGWIETGRELRQSIDQDELVTTFEVTDFTCVVPVLLFALDRFIRRRTPSAEYIERRYRGQTDAFRVRKGMDVILRTTLATALSQVLKDQPAGTLMNREGEPFQFPLSADFKVGTTWDDLPAVSNEELARTLGVPANLMGDTKSTNMATVPIVDRSLPGDRASSLLNPPKKIGPFPMREDAPVQPHDEALTECRNRFKKGKCPACSADIIWGERNGNALAADDIEWRQELLNINESGTVQAGVKMITLVPHTCKSTVEVEGNVDLGLEAPSPPMKAPVKEWGVMREMAQLLRETADRGSELNLEDRQRLRVTAELAEQAILDGVKAIVKTGVSEACKHVIGVPSEKVERELEKIKASFEEAKARFNAPRYHQHPVGPFLPIRFEPESEGSDS